MAPAETVIANNIEARRRLEDAKREPLFLADWVQALFIHYRIDPDGLQPHVPFRLDTWGGTAYISLVAFTLRNMRPARNGPLSRVGAWALKPIATHGFLNVRTYVRRHEEPGIFFLHEWLPNRLSVLLGPRTFGLPYHHARLHYDHDERTGVLRGRVVPRRGQGRIAYTCRFNPTEPLIPCPADSRVEFLLERYTAFTACGRQCRFRVWHMPWPQTTARVEWLDDSAVRAVFPWMARAGVAGAHYSPGVTDVWMGRPQRLNHRASPGVHP